MNEIPSGIVTITNKRYGMPLKLSVRVESDGDRGVWGSDTNLDTNTSRFQWRFVKTSTPVDGECYFIVNEGYKQPLKLSIHEESDGDRHVWGSGDIDITKPRERMLYWKVFHVGNDKYPYYKIVNCGYSNYLKLSLRKESDGDRASWAQHSDTDIIGQDKFVWRIEEY